MLEQPGPKRFRPLRASNIARMNGIGLAGDRTNDRVGIEYQTRFGALFDDLDDAGVFAPKRRCDPDARRVTDNLDEARHGVCASPRIGERHFVRTQSNDDKVGVIVTDKARKLVMPGRCVRRLSAANFVQGANGLHFGS